MQAATRYFLYVRKSTDTEDKQILSIDAQLDELRAFAKDRKLSIVEEIAESQSAKVPGRPRFNSMLRRIEAGEANGILAWNPDRLARNSKDGGDLIYLLDTAKLIDLKFPTFWFESTPQGKYMLALEFARSKQQVDNLSVDTRRGLQKKARMGLFPSHAPRGYIRACLKSQIY